MNYLEQLEKSIIFIESNLHEDIKVEEIAGSAGYSYYHFHRIFMGVVGESVGNYIWGTWIPSSGFEVDLRDDFEVYDGRFLGPDNDESEIDIYLPVK